MCYRAKKPAHISFEHQSDYCLATAQQDCPAFQESGSHNLPKNMRLAAQPALSRKFALIASVLLVVIILLGIQTVNRLNQTGLFAIAQPFSIPSPAQENIPAPNLTSLPAAPPPASSDTPEKPSTTSQIPTPSGTITLTPLPISLFALDTPSGNAPELLIHRMAPGESLIMLAELHNTSPEAIQHISYAIPTPVWVGWVVVIPLNTLDVSALPAFETYQVKDSSLTLRILAQQLSINLDEFKRYNQAVPDELLPLDGWLLIPHAEQATSMGG